MLSVFNYSLNAVLPIVLLGVLGYYARMKGWFSSEALRAMNRFNFRFCLSCMLFYNVYSASGSGGLSASLLITMGIALALLTIASVITANSATKVTRRKGVLAQAVFRSNYAIIGLPVVSALAGDSALGLASLFQIPCIIYYNCVSVLMLLHYSEDNAEGQSTGGKGTESKPSLSASLAKTFKGIFTNPLIIGLLLAVLVILIRRIIPRDAEGELVFSISRTFPWLLQVIRYLGNMATPMALIVLGAQMNFKSIASFRRELVVGVLMRLVGSPIIGFTVLFAASGLGFLTLTKDIVALSCSVFASPLAASSVVMSAEMNADDQLCGQIVAWSSVLGMFTLFIIVFCLRSIGQL
ncbi:MAG: AEC family transporter [Lachnospiraceae bacterium]|nr:AEC family transporter [Lachnospiraceae bacterium]